MQPWKISAGLTAALAGSAFLLGGSRLEYLAPHWPRILAEHGVTLTLHTGARARHGRCRHLRRRPHHGTGRPRPARRSRRTVRPARRGRPRPRGLAPPGRRGGLGVKRGRSRSPEYQARIGRGVCPATWRTTGQGAPPVRGRAPRPSALERCADRTRNHARRKRDETTLSLVEAARESGYSADHLGRLVRDGRIPNAGTARRAQDRARPGSAPEGITRRPSRDWRRSAGLPRDFEQRRSCSPSSRRESNDGTHET